MTTPLNHDPETLTRLTYAAACKRAREIDPHGYSISFDALPKPSREGWRAAIQYILDHGNRQH